MAQHSAWALLVGVAGCRCAPREPVIEVRVDHYVGFEDLVDAALRGDVDAVRAGAGQLTGGDPALVPEGQDGAESVGAALGFLALAEADELPEALVEAAAGCGACHEAVGRAGAGAVEWEHASAGRDLVDALVWPGKPGPSGEAEGDLATVKAAWEGSGTRAERAIAALGTCLACHGGG